MPVGGGLAQTQGDPAAWEKYSGAMNTFERALTWVQRDGENRAERNRRLKRWLARAYAIGLLVLSVALGIGLYPHHIVVSKHPSLLDVIFQSRTLVLCVRIVLLFVAGFVVVSLLARIWNSQWLSKAGPVGISDVVDLKRELESALEEVRANDEEINSLSGRIDASGLTIEELRERLDFTRLHAAEEVSALQKRLATAEQLNRDLVALVREGRPAERRDDEQETTGSAKN